VSALAITKQLQEKHKIIIIAILLAIMCLITYIFAIVVEVFVPYWHSFYIPIIFASLWWKRKGLAVAAFLVLLLLAGHWLAGFPFFGIDNFARAGTFVLVAYVVGLVSERQARWEEALQQAHDMLEIRVEERTADLSRANEALRVEIIERKRMESEIAEHREYLASVLRHAPDAIVTAGSSNRIVEWNPGAERLFGFTPDEARGKDCPDLVTAHDVSQAREQARFFAAQVLSGQRIPPTEVVCYRKDGAPVNAILSTSPIMIGDQVGGRAHIHRYQRAQADGGATESKRDAAYPCREAVVAGRDGYRGSPRDKPAFSDNLHGGGGEIAGYRKGSFRCEHPSPGTGGYTE